MNDEFKTDPLSEEIVKSLLSGTITESEQGILVKKIQVAMGSHLLKSISTIARQHDQLQNSIERILNNLTPRLEELAPDTPIDTLLDYYDRLATIQTRSAELTRKVAQGKPLFDFQILSDEEKMVAKLLGSFSSQEEKSEFLDMVRKWMLERHPNE